MKLEKKALLFSLVNNLIISILKIGGGLFYKKGSLFADGINTLCDFITDIIALVGTKISRKRPNKVHPFGYGRAEYISSLFIGILIITLGFWIIYNGITTTYEKPSLLIINLLILVMAMKGLGIVYSAKIARKINSQLLITSVKESKMDLYSSIAVTLTVIVSQFSDKVPMFRYADKVTNIIIGAFVMWTAVKLIKDNIISLIGGVDCDEKKIMAIKEIVAKNKEVSNIDVSLMKYGSYIKVYLTLSFNSNLNLNQLMKMERKIKKSLFKEKGLCIKYILIEIEN